MDPSSHNNSSFGFAYANKLAGPIVAAMKTDVPNLFPAGAVLVRERLAAATDTAPQSLVVMVKRGKGFSPASGDWEFLSVSGDGVKVLRRETTGSCFTCHASQKNHDYVFSYGK
jgi:hypothetical protein